MRNSLLLLFLFVLISVACQHSNKGGGEAEDDAIDSLTVRLVDSLNNINLNNISSQGHAMKDSVFIWAKRNLEIAEKAGYEFGQGVGLYTLGRYYIMTNDPAQATHHLLKSLEIFSRLGDHDFMSRCYLQLGMISYLIEFYEDGIRSLQLALKNKDIPTAKYLLALSYTKIGDYYNALDYFNQAIEHYDSVGESEYLSQCYLQMGQLYLDMGQPDSSFIALKRSKQYIDPGTDEVDKIRWYAFLSRAYLETGQIDSAIHYGEKSYQLETGKEDVFKDDLALIEATHTLSMAYSQKQQYKNAFLYLEKYHVAKTYFSKGNSDQKVTNMLKMFEFEKEMNQQRIQQERQQELAKQEITTARQLRNFLIAGAILLVILLLLLFNRYKIKRDSHKILEEKNEIISREKERSEELLLNILPGEVAEELKQKGEIKSRIVEDVTVIFTDFKGFTALTKEMPPRELVKGLHDCFSAFDRICEKYNVEKIKTIGDAYMAVGGIPVQSDSHAIDAVKAALEMVDYIQKLREQNIAEKRPFFEIRVGLHSGQVVAGIVGLKKFQYDIWGDTVNIANRMESHGLEGKVNISEKTYALVKDDPDLSFESRGRIPVKGGRGIEMWIVSRNKLG
jgi:class 3 adenylate cyclase/tetratricopeptide (TPR) repeat protein